MKNEWIQTRQPDGDGDEDEELEMELEHPPFCERSRDESRVGNYLILTFGGQQSSLTTRCVFV